MTILTLHTETYRAELVLHSQQVDSAIDLMYWSSICRLTTLKGKEFVFSSPTFSLTAKDLRRLAEYLEKHIESIRHHPLYESDIFVTYDLAFSLRAMAGEIWMKDGQFEGGFALLMLINVSEETTDRVEVGVQSFADINNIKDFTHSIFKLLAV